MEIDASTDSATIAKIKDHCMKTLDLVDISILTSEGSKTTLRLVGFKHHLAQKEIQKRFFNEIYSKNFPKHWEKTDQIANGSNFLSTH
jgi:hypothetical protein